MLAKHHYEKSWDLLKITSDADIVLDRDAKEKIFVIGYVIMVWLVK